MEQVLYAAGIVLLALVALTVIRTQLALVRGRSVAPSGARSPMDVYEAAYLAGGPRRVINTALVSLVSQGGLRVSRDGTVTPVHGFKPAKRVVVERAVYRQVASAPGGRTAAEVRHAATDAHAVRQLTIMLSRQGLLMPPGVRARSRRRARWLVVFTGLAAVVVIADALLHAPVNALVIAAVAAVAGVACFSWQRHLMMDPLTKAGRAALKHADVDDADGGWQNSDFGLVALHGLTKLPDRDLAGTLRSDTRARSRRYATCCAPGHCGSYSRGSPWAGSTCGSGGDGLFGRDFFGGLFGGDGSDGFGGFDGFGGGSHHGGGHHGGGHDGGGSDGGGSSCGGGSQ
ncbi:TIGR04222 domain-containing membrane protein [Nonomuraea guangzhouensis]|uniref:TIGR04222 domain-containing membrane protein n=1 Tax=Nonomuraea guangzhouensis TaxID=1291555 RepID=A0ABW4GUD0_9ACTN|nr:TIGR04222 domain-containing membrane protein [Nonomuraea guangzhouensis]